MITREQILEAVKDVKEPIIQRTLAELDAVRDVMIREDRISMTIVMSEVSDAAKDSLETGIRSLLSALTELELHLRFRSMTDVEREKAGLAAKAPQQQPTGREAIDSATKTNYIAVASGKGGVGKSTVTVNLAVSLARKGKRVGIIDADIYGFSVPDMMGIEERPDVVDNRVIPVERYGVKVISMGFFIEENAPVIWRGPMLGKMLRNFLTEVEWGELDYILLDLPPGTGDIALDVHQMIPQSKEVLVTTPHATAAFVAARAGAMALQTDHEIIGIVENMSYYACGACGEKEYVFGKGGGAKLAEQLNTPLLAQIPLGDPGNHPSEPDYSPSVYKEDSAIGELYGQVADAVIAACE